MLREKFLPSNLRVKDLDLFQDLSDASLDGFFLSEGTD